MDIRSYFKRPIPTSSSTPAESVNNSVDDLTSIELYADEDFDHTVENFWSDLKTMATKHLVKLGSSYVCESAFRTMNAIKTETWSRLTNENFEMALRIAIIREVLILEHIR